MQIKAAEIVGEGTTREAHQFRASPDLFKTLPTGVGAVLIAHGRDMPHGASRRIEGRFSETESGARPQILRKFRRLNNASGIWQLLTFFRVAKGNRATPSAQSSLGNSQKIGKQDPPDGLMKKINSEDKKEDGCLASNSQKGLGSVMQMLRSVPELQTYSKRI